MYNSYQFENNEDEVGSFSLKKGKYSIIANAVSLVVLICAFAFLPFIFSYNLDDIDELMDIGISLLLFAAIVIGFMFLGHIIQIILLKSFGGGKVKIHFGLIFDVYCEKPIKRNKYFFATQLHSEILCICLIILTCFFFRDYTYLSMVMITVNTLANIPIVLFIFKHDKNTSFQMRKGVIYVLQ